MDPQQGLELIEAWISSLMMLDMPGWEGPIALLPGDMGFDPDRDEWTEVELITLCSLLSDYFQINLQVSDLINTSDHDLILKTDEDGLQLTLNKDNVLLVQRIY